MISQNNLCLLQECYVRPPRLHNQEIIQIMLACKSVIPATDVSLGFSEFIWEMVLIGLIDNNININMSEMRIFSRVLSVNVCNVPFSVK